MKKIYYLLVLLFLSINLYSQDLNKTEKKIVEDMMSDRIIDLYRQNAINKFQIEINNIKDTLYVREKNHSTIIKQKLEAAKDSLYDWFNLNTTIKRKRLISEGNDIKLNLILSHLYETNNGIYPINCFNDNMYDKNL